MRSTALAGNGTSTLASPQPSQRFVTAVSVHGPSRPVAAIAGLGHTPVMPRDPRPESAKAAQSPPSTSMRRLRRTAAAAAEPLTEGLSAAVGGVSSVLEHALETIREMPGQRVRRVRRRGRHPLPSLSDLYPEADRARPVEVGLRTIDVDDIRGTAVGGGDQRGGDFLPIKRARGRNWQARWQRLRRAQDELRDLPPIDVVKYDDGYWVIDGHNRVALALYGGQVGIDASVVELVPPGGRRTEPIESLEAQLADSRYVRGRVEAEEAADEARQPDEDAQPERGD